MRNSEYTEISLEKRLRFGIFAGCFSLLIYYLRYYWHGRYPEVLKEINITSQTYELTASQGCSYGLFYGVVSFAIILAIVWFYPRKISANEHEKASFALLIGSLLPHAGNSYFSRVFLEAHVTTIILIQSLIIGVSAALYFGFYRPDRNLEEPKPRFAERNDAIQRFRLEHESIRNLFNQLVWASLFMFMMGVVSVTIRWMLPYSELAISPGFMEIMFFGILFPVLLMLGFFFGVINQYLRRLTKIEECFEKIDAFVIP